MKYYYAIIIFCFLSSCTIKQQINQTFKKDLITDTGYQKIRILLRYTKKHLEEDTVVAAFMNMLHKNDFLYVKSIIEDGRGLIFYTDSITPKGQLYLTDTIYRKYKYDTIIFGNFNFYKIKKIRINKIRNLGMNGDTTYGSFYDALFTITYKLTPMFANLKNKATVAIEFTKKGDVFKAENRASLNQAVYGGMAYITNLNKIKNSFLETISSDFLLHRFEQIYKQNSIKK